MGLLGTRNLRSKDESFVSPDNIKTDPGSMHRIGWLTHEFIPKGKKAWEFAQGFDVLIQNIAPGEELLNDHNESDMLNFAVSKSLLPASIRRQRCTL